MSLEIYVPPPPLANFIEMFWQWEGYAPQHPKERILPTGLMELTISLTDVPFRIYDPLRNDEPHSIYGAMALGGRSNHFVIETCQPMTILSAWFKAGGAVPFFGASGREIHNLHVPLEAVWGYAAQLFYEQLLEAQTASARFRILEGALFERLVQSKARHRAVDYALKLFGTAPQKPTIRSVVDQIALSPPRFIQVFREDVGLTPKQFCRVQRFQQATRLIAQGQYIDWVDVALACGYYDQAHFINEFRHFAGITPSAYAPQDPDHNLNLPVLDES